MQDGKDLEMIKGYVARLYTLVRSRTPSDQVDLEELGETIDDINTKLQIANSFQQDEIYNKLIDVENLLIQLLDVVPEKFKKVDEWMAMGLGHKGEDIIAYVIEESEKNYKVKEPFSINTWRGHNWARRGFEPMLLLGDKDTIVTWEKSRVFTCYKPSEEYMKEFLNSAAYNSNFKVLVDPWKTKVSIVTRTEKDNG